MIQDAKLTMPRNWAALLSDRIFAKTQERYSNVYISRALSVKPTFFNATIFNAFVDYKEELALNFLNSMDRLKSSTYESAK